MATAVLLPMPRAVFYDANGNPLAGGFVNTYIANTTTPKTTWQDTAETTPNANPVVLDSAGSALIYGTGSYSFAVTDALSNAVPGYSGVTFAGATTSADLTYAPTWTGAVTRVITARLMDYTSVKDFGAAGDGVTDDTAAIVAAFAAVGDVAFPPGTYLVTSNIAIPAGDTAHIVGGARLSVNGGVTVTVNGTVIAPIEQIFTGGGSVVGMRQVYPEWWGALGNGTGNDLPSLQAAHTCIQASQNSDGGRPTIFLTRSQYQVASTWTVAPTANINLAVVGNAVIFTGTRIVAASTFSPAGPVVLIDGNTDPVQCLTDWEFRNIGIIASAGGYGAANAGLQIGSTSPAKFLQGVQMSKVEDVYVQAIPNGLFINHARLIQFNRCSVWNNSLAIANSCVLIQQSGLFTGDLTFNDCQWVNQNAAGRVGLNIQSAVGPFSGSGNPLSGATCVVAGIRFNGCIGYPAATYVNIICTSAARLLDVWFEDGTQFDGGSTNGIAISTLNAGSLISDIHFDHVYVDGATADMITVTTGASSNVQNLWIMGCWLSQAVGRAVIVGGTGLTTGLHVCHNAIDSCTTATSGAITISNTGSSEIIGNVLTRSGVQTCTFVATLGSGCDWLICTNNNSSGVSTSGVIQDLSGGINKVVTNNI